MPLLAKFVGLDLGEDIVPNARIILGFRYLPKRRGLA